MALQFDIELDDLTETFDAPVDDYEVEFARAVQLGVGMAAYFLQRRLTQEIDARFDRPNEFTRKAIGTRVTNPFSQDPVTTDMEVYVKPLQVQYLKTQIDGGVRRAGDYATTSQGPLIPGPDAPRDRHGNLPRGYVQKALRDPNVSWMTFKGRDKPTLVRRTPGKLQILAIVVEETSYEPRFDFYGIVQREGAKAVARFVTIALAKMAVDVLMDRTPSIDITDFVRPDIF